MASALTLKVLDEIGRDIVAGTIPAGSVLLLDDLIERTGVSRTVARDAVKVLEAQGLVLPRRHVGIEVLGVGVKDVILPGEMKDILNSVVQAEKAAQANVIRRREEANATRSLLNTAKLIEDSPVLMRLKELETLEKVTEKIDKLTVFGGLDGVLKQLVTLK